MPKPKLEPCPICGGEPVLAMFVLEWRVFCEKTDKYAMVLHEIHAEGDSKKSAVRRWNSICRKLREKK